MQEKIDKCLSLVAIGGVQEMSWTSPDGLESLTLTRDVSLDIVGDTRLYFVIFSGYLKCSMLFPAALFYFFFRDGRIFGEV